MYHEGNRELQDQFGSRALADRLLEQNLARIAFTDDDKAFIENLPYFFLATADAEGRPECSFKGGMPGFVRVTGPSELAWPDYDGNGMFKSLGNAMVNPNVGLLFIAMHGQAAAPEGQRDGNDKPRRSAARPGGGRAADHPRRGPCDLPQLPALHPDHADRSSRRSTRRKPAEAPVEPKWKGSPDFKDVVPPRKPTA